MGEKVLFPSPGLNGEDLSKNDFLFEAKLGDGAFGEVWKIKDKKSAKYYACKVVEKASVRQMNDQFRREVMIMYKLDHSNIVKLFHHFEDSQNFYLVMELAEGGNLFSKLSKEKTFIERLAFKFFKEVLTAVEYLHSQTPIIIHRDIKPENILITAQGRAKLSDFGWSNYYSADRSMPRYTICGTYEYLCPEMVKETGHTPAVDIWCLGILLYEMICGYTPFKAHTKEMLMENISKGKIQYPASISLQLKALINKMLDRNPEKRITVTGIKNSEWYKKFEMSSPMIKRSETTKEIKTIELKKNRLKTKQVHLNLVRKSIMALQDEVTVKQEKNIETINNIKDVSQELQNGAVTVKVLEREILEAKKNIILRNQELRELKEMNEDLNAELGKIFIPNKIEEIAGKIKKTELEVNLKDLEITELKSRNTQLKETISQLEKAYLDKSRYSDNLNSYLKRLKEKGSLLHRNTGSQITELQISYNSLKTKITEVEKTLEDLETPENKFARNMMIFVKEKKEKVFEICNFESKLLKVEEDYCLKEVQLEKIKIEYLEMKKKIIKDSWISKEKILKKKIEKQEIFERLSKRIDFQELVDEYIEKTERTSNQFRYLSSDLTAAEEKINSLKQQLDLVYYKISKLKSQTTNRKTLILEKIQDINSIEMELGAVKCKTLSMMFKKPET